MGVRVLPLLSLGPPCSEGVLGWLQGWHLWGFKGAGGVGQLPLWGLGCALPVLLRHEVLAHDSQVR